jgi:hypothetical protein
MIKEQSTRLLNRINNSLRRKCGNLSPKKRLVIVLALCTVLCGGSVYITVSSIYSTCKNESGNRYYKQEHYIKRLKLQVSDSIKQFIEKDHE